MTRVKIQKGSVYEGWEHRLANPERALKQIGAIMLAESQKAFREQKFGKVTWRARRVPNVFGIIADFSMEGRSSPPKRRFEATPVLKDTGRLRQSMSFRLVGKDTVEVGTNMGYASVHNFGGPIESLPITETVQKKLAKFLKREGKKNRFKAHHLGALERLLRPRMKGKTLKGKVPARPFVGITEETYQKVERLVGLHIFDARGGKNG